MSRHWHDHGMCNLYTVRVTGAELASAFNTTAPSFDFAGDADFYPKSLAAVIRDEAGARIIDRMHWGFPPPMAARGPVTNVRNLTSTFWKSALARPDRRCLVPVTRFCEWEGEKGSKAKRWFSLPSQPIFAFAGLWRPTDAGAAFAFLTCEPNPLVAAVHPKAMPVILHPEDYDLWLSGTYDDACALAQPFPSQLMAME
jgi:putative SOS response-associated peptidase YedK